MKKIFKILNQPIVVGLLILLSTSLVQQWGWKSQQIFIDEQLKANTTREQAQATIDQVTGAVGKLLTSYASIVGAHEEKVNTKQLNQTIDEYHVLQREWDKGEDLLKLRMKTYYSAQAIQSEWSSLLEQLGKLDSEIHQLHDFNTSDASAAHQAQIKACRDSINEVEKQLAAMTEHMVNP